MEPSSKGNRNATMNITLIAIGKNLPAWVNQPVNEFAKRLSAFCHFKLIEIPMQKRNKKTNIQPLIEEEGDKLLAATPKNSVLITLDETGNQWSSIELSQQIQTWQMHHSNITLLIGGPDGLANKCLQQAETSWSLSRLTYPHTLARIIAVEQLYRALTIAHHHPYHRK